MRYLLALIAVALLAGCSEQQSMPAPPSTHAAAPTQPTVLPPPSTQPVAPYHRIVVIGDSYTEGTDEGGRGVHGWPALVWGDLQAQGVQVRPIVAGEGGAGYVNRGWRGFTFDHYAQTVTRDTELVVFFGGSNDADLPPDQLAHRFETAAHFAFIDAKTVAPTATLMVIGPACPWPVSMEDLRVRDSLRDQAQAVGAMFVDPIAERWLVETPELIGADGVHPTDDGHKYLAARIEPLIRSALRS
jgi:lysophospholipase L1-like esterase